MPLPRLTIDPAFADRGVAVHLGLLSTHVAPEPRGLDQALDEAVRKARERARDGAASVPEIKAARAAYKRCGKDPSRYRPASEALLRRVLKGEAPPRVNPVVDVNNLLSLETGLAMGVYDTARLEPPLLLRIGQATDAYEGIGRGALNVEGLPVLADGRGPVGSPTSDSTRAAVTEAVTDVLLVIYGFDAAPEDALDLARDAFERHLGARGIETALVSG